MGTGWDIVPAWRAERAATERRRAEALRNLNWAKLQALRAFLRAGRTRWPAR